jgi:Skp1 family, tetramerisation domain
MTEPQTETAVQFGKEEVVEPMITLLSSDDVVFTLPKEAATLSDLIANIINIDDNDGCQQEGYKLDRVVSSTLQKVVEFMTYYHSNPMMPIPEVVLSTYVLLCLPFAPYVKPSPNNYFFLSFHIYVIYK